MTLSGKGGGMEMIMMMMVVVVVVVVVVVALTLPSPVVPSGTFSDVVSAAAMDARRHVTLLQTSGAALDHTTTLDYPESKYLTALLLSVS